MPALESASFIRNRMDTLDTPVETASRAPWWRVVLVGRDLRVTALRLFVTVAIVVAGFRSVLLPMRVTGVSMAPTYKDGQKAYANRLSLWLHPPRRGDILAIRTTGIHNLFLKRVIALPGERVKIMRGHVFVDGEELDEPYLINPAPWNWPAGGREEVMGPDEYLMIGDNRTMPVEQHEFGAARRAKLVGRVLR